ncbi:MAG TPA: 4-hydroxy-tetrahydrodipicolinate reductase, partial [Patescibacteria group bacterium]|nr:4-hydroxy-tetrahydrodipicolinate reductase [Patescibacteria group bacterium]
MVVCGAMGRMGRAILGILKEGPHGFSLTGAVEAAGHPLLTQDAFEAAGAGRAGVPVTDDFAKAVAASDVAIDFTAADSSARNAGAAAAAGKPIVIGSTGLGPTHMERIRNAAAKVAIVQ